MIIFKKITIILICICFLRCNDTYPLNGSLPTLYRNDEFKDVVINKYIDKSNHSEACISFNNPKARIFFSYRPDGDRKKLWDYVMIGDTIRKIKKTNTILVKRVNEKDSLFYLYYDCVDTMFLSKLK